MKSSKALLILVAIAVGVICGGCSILPSKGLYVPMGSAVEVAAPARVQVYYTNKETGKREKRTVMIKPDGVWHLGRLLPPEPQEPDQ